ncbi:hypothetical protein O4215_20725 [Rhodococcus maanshanensis]|uniref:hypothetical protein n=1 Tax=Rhodococcus maanshanensis TaxID=183556 RepID=UPI0022B55E1F|nr:hypothetical protein [Rhodococcus maanshanensis]MCZ4557990.1 hypothetical protein [Rhodococcus maanshanensis]
MTVLYELVGVQVPGKPRTVWKFGDPGCPLRLAQTPTGLGGAKFKHSRQSNARQPGATWRGRVDEINLIKLALRIGPVTEGAPALALWHSWRASLGRGEALAEFHVRSPGGGDRFQWVRLEEAVPDPDLTGLEWNGYMDEEVILAGDFPWWIGEAFERTYTPAQFAGLTITNAGDVPSWPYVELTGPGTFTFGVGTEAIVLPAIGPGQKWRIETDDEAPFVRNAAGADVWDQLGPKAWFQNVPANDTVPLNLSVTGAGAGTSALIRLPQMFERAAA